MKKEPKFKVGQVVRERSGERRYFAVERIVHTPKASGDVGTEYDVGTIYTWDEEELRPLTARERGGKK